MEQAKSFSIVAMIDQNRGIGVNGKLPCRLPKDMEQFKTITTKCPEGMVNVVIMGRKTWESIPEKFRPLPDRINIILTRTPKQTTTSNVLYCQNFKDALDVSNALSNVHQIFIIGGQALYEEAILYPKCEALYLTRVEASFPCDRHFPEIPSNFSLEEKKPPIMDGSYITSYEYYRRSI